MHGKCKILLDVPETGSHLNVKHSCGFTELKMEEYQRFWH